MSAEINAVIQQHSKAGSVREIQILGGKEVRVISGLKSKQQVYHVSLLALADKSHLRLHIAKHWMWGIIASVIALACYALVKSIANISLGVYEFSFITAFSIAALLSLIMFGLHISRKRVFYSRNANVPLFDLLIGNPDQKSYKDFLKTLNKHIQEARSYWQLKPQQQVAGEIKMLRRLASEGVISQRDYEHAKDKLFAKNS